jgi:hypothetical protein
MSHPFITVGFTTRRYSVIIHSQFASTMTHLPPHALAAPIAAGAGRARTDRAPPNHPLNAYGLWRLRVSSPGVLSAPERPSHQRLQRHLLPCARVRRQAHGRGVPVCLASRDHSTGGYFLSEACTWFAQEWYSGPGRSATREREPSQSGLRVGNKRK